MKVLFIVPQAYSAYHFQIAAIVAYLKREGHEVGYLELVLGYDWILGEEPKKVVEEKLDSFKPDLIAFSAYDMAFEWIRQIVAVVKKKQSTPILVGGYTATLAPQSFYEIPEIDYIGVGEGELIMAELLKKMKAGEECLDIPGIYVRKNGKWIENPSKYTIEDLDTLPFIDRDFLDLQTHIGIPGKGQDVYLPMMASRGCPYKCSYCANEFLKGPYETFKDFVRFRDPERICDEIEECARHYKFNKVGFEDALFIVNKGWLEHFGEVYTKRIGLPFCCNIRPETATKKNTDLLAKIGCEKVCIGLESGDPELRKMLLGRNMSDKLLCGVSRNLKSSGIKLRTYNIVGLPGETYTTLFRTIRLNYMMAPEEVQTHIYYPLKGTLLGDKCFSEGLVDLEKLKRIKVFAYETPLKENKVPNAAIVAAKWINSSMALRSGNLDVIKIGFRLITNKFDVQRQRTDSIKEKELTSAKEKELTSAVS